MPTGTEALAATAYSFGASPTIGLTVPGDATALLVGLCFSGNGGSPWGASVPTFGGVNMTLVTSGTGSGRDVGTLLYELMDLTGRSNDNLAIPSIGVNGIVVQATFLSGLTAREDEDNGDTAGGNCIATLDPGSETCFGYVFGGVAGSGAVGTGNISPYGSESTYSEGTYDPGGTSSICGGAYYLENIASPTSLGMVASGSSVVGHMVAALYADIATDELADLSRIGEETGFRAIDVSITEDSMVYLTRRPGEETGFRALTVRPFGPRQVALVGEMLETSEMTEDGTEGQVLTYHEDAKPTWEDPSAGASALDDLTDVDAPAPDDGDVLTWDEGAGEWVAAPGGGDHGGLTGLADDDHTQYALGFEDDDPPTDPGRGVALWLDTDDTSGAVPSDSYGTAFPGSPTTGQRFYRTNVRGGMWFRYDGTRWLSDQQFTLAVGTGQSFASSQSNFYPVPTDYSIYVEWVEWHIYQTGTWSLDLKKNLFDESSYPSIMPSATARSTSGLTSSRWYTFRDVCNAVVDGTGANSGTSVRGLSAHYTRTGGSLYNSGTVTYRLIAT